MRLFQDAAGTIPAYEAGQPVGKVTRAAGTVDASQATALSRPTLARMPKGGRRNLIVRTPDKPWQAGGQWAPSQTTVTDNNGSWSVLEVATTNQKHLSYPILISGWATTTLEIRLIGPDARSITVEGRRADGTWMSARVNLVTGAISGAPAGLTITSQALGDGWWKIIRTFDYGVGNTYSNNALVLNSGGSIVNYEGNPASGFELRKYQIEPGAAPTNYQSVMGSNNITETGVPDIWYLFNDGGDSLLAPLSPGVWEVATVGHLGKVDYTPVTGDGADKNILFGERVADIFARPGTLTDAERLRLEEYWQQRYGAGYLTPPGMVPGARSMWRNAFGSEGVLAAGDPVGTLIVDYPKNLGAELRGGAATYTVGTPSVTPQYDPGTGNGKIVRDAAETVGAVRLPPLEVGAEYEITFSSITGGNPSLRQSSATGGVAATVYEAQCRAVFTAGHTNVFLSLGLNGLVIDFTGMSLRKLSNRVAYQGTALSRPTLARWPKGGRRNLVVNTTITPDSDSLVTPISGRPGWFDFFAAAGINNGRVRTGSHGPVQAGQVYTGSALIDTAAPFTQSVQLCVGINGSFRANVPFTVPLAGAAPVLGAASTSMDYFGAPTATVEHVSGTVWRVSLTTAVVAETISAIVVQLWRGGAPASNTSVRFGLLQLEVGGMATPAQLVVSGSDVTGEGKADIWHLYNDGGDSLPAVLPAGAWEIAWVTPLGTIGYASVTSDGTTGTELLRAERMADVALKRGRFTSYEKAQLETQWGKYKP